MDLKYAPGLDIVHLRHSKNICETSCEQDIFVIVLRFQNGCETHSSTIDARIRLNLHLRLQILKDRQTFPFVLTHPICYVRL